MSAAIKNTFLQTLQEKFGPLGKIGEGQSLFSLQNDSVRLYIRYSKVHPGKRCFYGLRQNDLGLLEGHNAFICLLWNNQDKPLILPFAQFEEVFRSVNPADDGQYKVQVYLRDDETEFYVAQAGRFSVNGYFGFDEVAKHLESSMAGAEPSFSHAQIQTLLGAIGNHKNCQIWIPTSDREGLDWSLSSKFQMLSALPPRFGKIEPYLSQIDVVWLEKGSSRITALYEVEHSTPIYSGLLRFNDVLLAENSQTGRLAIVSNERRRSLFVQQVNRPTFKTSGLSEICTFFDYINVYRWHQRLFTHPTKR